MGNINIYPWIRKANIDWHVIVLKKKKSCNNVEFNLNNTIDLEVNHNVNNNEESSKPLSKGAGRPKVRYHRIQFLYHSLRRYARKDTLIGLHLFLYCNCMLVLHFTMHITESYKC